MKIVAKIKTRVFRKKMVALGRRARNINPALQSIRNVLESSVEQNFIDEGRPKKWKKLKAATIKARERKNKWPGKILTVSAQLRSSVNSRAQNRSVIIGSNKVYAPPVDKLRNFLLFQKEDIQESREILRDHLLKGIRKR